MTNDVELRVVGMARSGNHAIIHWILQQATGRRLFLNCAEPKTNPFTSARPLAHGSPYEASFDGFDLAAEAAGALSPKDLLVYSYEDCFLGMLTSPTFEEARDRFVGRSRRRLDVLILRDPFNLFASRRKADAGCVTDRTMVRIWKQHAREALEARYLGADRVVILFNRWRAQRAYRHRIARQLGLPFTDAGVDDVRACAGGSSFDGRRYDGRAGRMNVFDRWRHYADDDAYRALFDDEVLDFTRRIFGPLPAADALAGTTALEAA